MLLLSPTANASDRKQRTHSRPTTLAYMESRVVFESHTGTGHFFFSLLRDKSTKVRAFIWPRTSRKRGDACGDETGREVGKGI